MEKRTICIIYDCDEWKTRGSMRFICACDPEFLPEFLEEIRLEREYTDDEMTKYIFIEETTLNDF